MDKYSIYIMDAQRGKRIYNTEVYEHMFIYMGNNTGIMLTSTAYKNRNYPVDPKWFDCHFKIRNTHYVPENLIKEAPKAIFKKINGGLSEEGKRFFDEIIKDKTPIHWNDYVQKNRLTVQF